MPMNLQQNCNLPTNWQPSDSIKIIKHLYISRQQKYNHNIWPINIDNSYSLLSIDNRAY